MFSKFDFLVESAWDHFWEWFLDGFAWLILPDDPYYQSDDLGNREHSQTTHEDEAFREWDDIGGEG